MTKGEGEMNMRGNKMRNEDDMTFGFPITDATSNFHMKNISPLILPQFQELFFCVE